MIIKNSELDKIKNYNSIFLFYGKNDGLKEISIKELIENNQTVLSYDQVEIIEKQESFLEEIYSQSLFEKEKLIIIKRVNDKIFSIIKKIELTKIGVTKIILDSEYLDKKSKLRSFFEKEKNLISSAFYPDNDQILLKLAIDFFKKKNMSISYSSLNLIINKTSKDRKALFNELNKLYLYAKNGKAINDKTIAKIINLNENHEISELIDCYFIQNQKKVISILNENNFNNEDCIIIIRNFLNKSKRLLNLSKEYFKSKNIEKVIASAKPPIFWKEKEIIKKQIYKWNTKDLRNIIYKLFNIELLIKKNINNSIYLITDFINSNNINKN